MNKRKEAFLNHLKKLGLETTQKRVDDVFSVCRTERELKAAELYWKGFTAKSISGILDVAKTAVPKLIDEGVVRVRNIITCEDVERNAEDSIYKVGLNPRIAVVLDNHAIRRLRDLQFVTRKSVSRFRGIGKTYLEEIDEVLRKAGMDYQGTLYPQNLVDALGLNERVTSVLHKAGVNIIAKLKEYSYTDLLTLPSLSVRDVDRINTALMNTGSHLCVHVSGTEVKLPTSDVSSDFVEIAMGQDIKIYRNKITKRLYYQIDGECLYQLKYPGVE